MEHLLVRWDWSNEALSRLPHCCGWYRLEYLLLIRHRVDGHIRLQTVIAGAGDTEYSNTMRYEDSLQFPAGTFFLYLPHYKQSVVAIYGNWVFCRRRADNWRLHRVATILCWLQRSLWNLWRPKPFLLPAGIVSWKTPILSGWLLRSQWQAGCSAPFAFCWILMRLLYLSEFPFAWYPHTSGGRHKWKYCYRGKSRSMHESWWYRWPVKSE